MTTQNQTEPTETAVTGKPLADYELYVDLLANVLANGLALSTQPDFIATLDLSLPLHEAVRDAARDSIKWRFAFDIDDIEAARNAAEQETKV